MKLRGYVSEDIAGQWQRQRQQQWQRTGWFGPATWWACEGREGEHTGEGVNVNVGTLSCLPTSDAPRSSRLAALGDARQPQLPKTQPARSTLQPVLSSRKHDGILLHTTSASLLHPQRRLPFVAQYPRNPSPSTPPPRATMVCSPACLPARTAQIPRAAKHHDCPPAPQLGALLTLPSRPILSPRSKSPSSRRPSLCL
jgi:hypothetical protein